MRIVGSASPFAWPVVPLGYVVAALWLAAGRPESLVGGPLLIVLATWLAIVFVRLRCDVRMTADGIRVVRRGRSEYIPAGAVRRVTTRHELRWSSTQWGRGYAPVSTLFLGLAGGRTVDVFTTPDVGLSRVSWRDLNDGLVALPYGRLPRRGPSGWRPV